MLALITYSKGAPFYNALTTVTKDGSRSSVQSLEVSYRPHLAVS